MARVLSQVKQRKKCLEIPKIANLNHHSSPDALAAWVLELIGAVCKDYRIDTNRIYLMGVSQGGYGTCASTTLIPQAITPPRIIR